MLSRKQSPGEGIDHMAVNACLCPVYAAAGCHVITVEGIGNPRDGLHPVQARLADAHGSQCGFCTPGFVMSMYALLRSTKGPLTEGDIEAALAGNLCRCTGYRPIWDALATFVGDTGASSGAGCCQHGADDVDTNGEAGGVCPATGLPCACTHGLANGGKQSAAKAGPIDGGQAAEARSAARKVCTAEPIFPPELAALAHESFDMPGSAVSWHRCTTLPELLSLRAAHPDAKLVGGNTEVGIEMRVRNLRYPVLIDATLVPELRAVVVTDEGMEIGGCVTLTVLKQRCEALAEQRQGHEVATLRAVARQLHWFAGVQVRNVATLAGNLATGSPISDLNPIWIACRAVIRLESAARGRRDVAASDFFLGYRRVDMEPGEIIRAMVLPWSRPFEVIQAYKQSHRRDDDIALVNACMRVRFGPAQPAEEQRAPYVVQEASLVFGGVGPTAVVATQAASALVGRALDDGAVQGALQALRGEVAVSEGAPGGMGAYRSALTRSLLFKFLVTCGNELQARAEACSTAEQLAWLDADARSAVAASGHVPLRGVQFHAEAEPAAIVGQPVKHRAADLQVTGTAQYMGDVPLPPGTLHAALITSTIPHGRILSVDTYKALIMPGVAAIYLASDIPGENQVGPVFADEPLFAQDTVTAVGQPLGVVLASTHDDARRAALAVRVVYEALPAVVSIDEAIKEGSFHPQYDRTLEAGDVEAAFAAAEAGGAIIVEGSARVGGQEHFYLEPHCNFAVPVEDDEMLLMASTQDVAKHQKLIARVLGVPHHKLVVRTRRLGGGFGGKETRGAFLHCATAVAASHARRPVSMVLERQDDMQMTGHRHAFMGKYKAAFAADGRVLALSLELFCNAGNSVDLSHAIMDRAILHSDCASRIPAVRIRGRMCRTNQASNTAFRGFGGPQGMVIANMWMDHGARALRLPLCSVCATNMYEDGDIAHFGQAIEGSRLRRCWKEVMQSAEWDSRRTAVDSYNARSRYRKRGLAALPTKFGIAFTFQPMNQAGALVSIYLDGSVAVSHGGIEMGQGLHTKICQVTAQALGVSLDAVHVSDTSTDKVPNSSPTAASASSDLYGAAVLEACGQLNSRLEPLRRRLGREASMKEVAHAAWMDRVDLCAHGFYRTPGITGAEGEMPFNYFVYGAAVAEVELDCLTGDWHSRRVDIAMDVGNPINPAIDIGQVEGGFVQGLGWACLEELKWGDSAHPWVRPGRLHTNGPGAYKIPTLNDIPLDFRVTLLDDMANTRAIHSSKAVGEPPFHLGVTTLFALKDAVYSARADASVEGFLPLDLPATPERLRMACVDCLANVDASYRPLLSC